MTSTGSGKAQHTDPFGLVDNADEFPRRSGQDFFARQGAAAALDQVQVLVGLIGAIDVEIHGCRLRSAT